MKIIETNLEFKGLKKRRCTKRIIIHHSDSGDVTAQTIHGWHLNKGWAGIGYHFVIRQNGSIERGRPEWAIGSHSGPNGNGDSIGICLAGSFMNTVPTNAQLAALVELINSLCAKYGDLKVLGHKDVMATACPGAMFPWTQLSEMLKGENEMMVPVKITIDGKELPNGHISKLDGKDTSFAPVKTLAEALGAKVRWDAATSTVIVERGK